ALVGILVFIVQVERNRVGMVEIRAGEDAAAHADGEEAGGDAGESAIVTSQAELVIMGTGPVIDSAIGDVDTIEQIFEVCSVTVLKILEEMADTSCIVAKMQMETEIERALKAYI